MYKNVAMSLKEFMAIPSNPIQRDEAQHGRIFSRPPYGHLSKWHPTHIKVAMAVTPDGKQKWKLDGHTRMWCVENGRLDWPKGQKLQVDVWEVADADEAAHFYTCYDGFSGSHETAGDKLSGSFRYHKFEPHKPHMWRETGLITAINYMILEKRWGQSKVLTVVQMLTPWMDTIRAIDMAMDPWYNSNYFPSPFTCAMLATVRVYGKDALKWWQMYHDTEMSRTAKSVDGVYKAHDLLQEFKNPLMTPMTTRGGTVTARGRRLAELAPKIIFCFERQYEGKRFPVTVGKGKRHWTGMLSFPDWWDERIGERDHPELIAMQQEFELLELADGDD